ncbi:hypothetical protein FJY93_04535 [Candidatus Kaiserbacteria bacterium]|nr:hypothetical protein [Candidatus Kaiserbacteria bacterium]
MSLENKEAYEWPVHELMERFQRSFAQAAISGSGLVIDCTGSYYTREAIYLGGVIEARLTLGDKIKDRPFRAGDFVRMGKNFGSMVFSRYIGSSNRSLTRDDARGKTFRVQRVLYSERKWWLYFHEFSIDDEGREFCFPADVFEVVPQLVDMPAQG